MRRLVLALALSATLVPQAFAWDEMGHMMVAAVAYEQLTPAVRTRVNHLLQLNPSYKQWAAGKHAGPRDELIFMQASTWADDIKTKPGYINDEDSATTGDEAAPTGYADMRQHRSWHYASTPISTNPRSEPLGPAPTPNLITQIAALRQELGSDAPDEVRSYALVWLLNLVADAHQPLHVTTRITRSSPKGDDNGRQVALCKKPCRNNLHDYWDALLGSSKKPEAALAAAHNLPKPFAKLAQIDDEKVWAEDSVLLAQKVAYSPPVGTGLGPYTIDEDYHKAALPLASRQLANAGARLARLLNAQLSH